MLHVKSLIFSCFPRLIFYMKFSFSVFCNVLAMSESYLMTLIELALDSMAGSAG